MDTQDKRQLVEQDPAPGQKLLESVIRLFPDPVFIFDQNGKCLEVMGGNEWSLFRNGSFLVNKYLHDLLPVFLADQFMQSISEAVADNSLKTFECHLGAEDIAGTPPDSRKGRQWFECRIYPRKKDENEPGSVICLPVNITQRKSLEEQVAELSARDQLTKAYNRRYFMQLYEMEFAIAKRYRNRLAVLHIAIDRLQHINDTYGQGAGDAVLKRFTVFCESNLRNSDLFARYGGAGFIALLPNTPSLGAAIIAERLRAHVESLRFDHEGQTIQFTISMGISEIADTDASSKALLSRADAALYQAKKKGRNRIELN